MKQKNIQIWNKTINITVEILEAIPKVLEDLSCRYAIIGIPITFLAFGYLIYRVWTDFFVG